jgi:phage-related protein
MADLEVLRITVEAQTKDAEGAFKRLVQVLGEEEKAHKGAARGAKEHAEGLKKPVSAYAEFKKALKSTATEMASVKQLLGTALRAFEDVFNLVEDAARTQAAARYFKEAGRSLEELREVSKGMVSDANLMKKANLADSMGLSEDTFKSLITVAQAASVKTGQSFDYMFDSIVTGTARSSRLLLDNLGIIVNVKEANIAYAKELQKEHHLESMSIDAIVKSMTAEAKQMAFINALSKEAAKNTEAFKRIGTGGAEVFDKWGAAVDNLKLALGSSFTNMLQGVLEQLTELVDKATGFLNRKNASAGLIEKYAVAYQAQPISGQDVVDLRAGVNIPGAGILKPDPSMFGGNMAVAEQAFSENVSVIAQNVLDNKIEALKKLALQESEWLIFKEFSDLLKPGTTDLAGLGKAMRDNFGPALRQATTDVLQLYRALGHVAPKGGESKLSREEALDSDALNRAAKAKAEEAAEKEDEENTRRILKFAQEVEERQNLEAAAQKELDEKRRLLYLEEANRSEAALAAAKKQRENDDVVRKIQEEVNKEHLKRLEEEREARLDSVATGINTAAGLVSGDNATFISTIATAIGTAFGAPQIGTAIGNLLGPFMGGLTSLSRIVKPLFQGFAKLVELILGPIFDALSPLGPALYVLLVAVGVLVSSAIRPFLDIILFFATGFASIIVLVSALLTILSSLIEVFIALWLIVATLGLVLLGWGTMQDLDIMRNRMDRFVEIIIGAAVFAHNGIVAAIRKIPGMSDFGGDDWELGVSDFQTSSEAETGSGWGAVAGWDVESTLNNQVGATEANTEALRDLARELHNLPAGYRGLAAIWASSQVEGPSAPTVRPENYQVDRGNNGRKKDPRPYNLFR